MHGLLSAAQNLAVHVAVQNRVKAAVDRAMAVAGRATEAGPATETTGVRSP